MPTSRNYHSYLIESLKDPQEAYLEAVLEDSDYDELLSALKDVAEARLNISQTAPNQEVVQKIQSLQGNLDFVVLQQVLSELGFKLSVTPTSDAA